MGNDGPTLPLALRFISGKYQGGEFPIPVNGEIVIGRSSELEMVLVEDMVSRRHAKITVSDGNIQIEDLGSTNGSFVNGERVTKTTLAEGDRILVGTSIIKVVATEADGSVAEAKQQMQDVSVKKRTAHEGSTMTGSIAEVALPDLLQLFSASKKKGVLVITTDEDEGRIYLDDGRVVFASVNGDETVAPDKAFYRVLVWTEGTFDLLPAEEREFPEQIQMSTEGLLMEGMRQLDEIHRLGEDLPPLSAVVQLQVPLEVPLRDASPEQLDIIQLVHNYSTVAEVMNHSGQPDTEVAEVLVQVLKAGYVTVVD